MKGDAIFGAHVLEHMTQPVIGDGGDQVGNDAELGAAEGRGDRVAAEGNGIGRGDVFFVSGGHVIGDESDVDIALSDKKCLHEGSTIDY